ncbi:MAG: hypothetical protein KKH83_05895 [Candidatus Margulisbacteria bacterium]|nr:hypothetical protein [Candidatus Margulisiibacteriota bacterium]
MDDKISKISGSKPLALLQELKKKKILPLAKHDKQFPDLVAKAVISGKVRIVRPKNCPPHHLASYYSVSNTLALCGRQEKPDIESLVHELYHAYQDAIKYPGKTESEMEAAALLIALKYVAHTLGIKDASAKNEQKLLQYAFRNRSWFLGHDPAQLKGLLEAVTTTKKAVWERELKNTAHFHRLNKCLNEVMSSLMGRNFRRGRDGSFIIDFRLEARRKIVTLTLSKSEVSTLFEMLNSTKNIKDAYELNNLVGNFVKYWEKIAERFTLQLSEMDNNFTPMDGVN